MEQPCCTSVKLGVIIKFSNKIVLRTNNDKNITFICKYQIPIIKIIIYNCIMDSKIDVKLNRNVQKYYVYILFSFFINANT